MTSRSCPPSRARGGEGESVGGGGFVPQEVELEVVGPLEVEREAAQATDTDTNYIRYALNPKSESS